VLSTRRRLCTCTTLRRCLTCGCPHCCPIAAEARHSENHYVSPTPLYHMQAAFKDALHCNPGNKDAKEQLKETARRLHQMPLGRVEQEARGVQPPLGTQARKDLDNFQRSRIEPLSRAPQSLSSGPRPASARSCSRSRGGLQGRRARGRDRARARRGSRLQAQWGQLQQQQRKRRKRGRSRPGMRQLAWRRRRYSCQGAPRAGPRGRRARPPKRQRSGSSTATASARPMTGWGPMPTSIRRRAGGWPLCRSSSSPSWRCARGAAGGVELERLLLQVSAPAPGSHWCGTLMLHCTVQLAQYSTASVYCVALTCPWMPDSGWSKVQSCSVLYCAVQFCTTLGRPHAL